MPSSRRESESMRERASPVMPCSVFLEWGFWDFGIGFEQRRLRWIGRGGDEGGD